jgi:hypothetical protein
VRFATPGMCYPELSQGKSRTKPSNLS